MPDRIPKITVKAARVNAGLNQEDAARLLGISLSTLQNYEGGKTIPDVITMRTMEEVYQFPSNRIFFQKKSRLNRSQRTI